MTYGIYKSVRNAAWQCLIDTGTSELPVSVTKLAQHYNINVVKDSVYKVLEPPQSGVSFLAGDRWCIIYNDTAAKRRTRFTIAHELGHILLGHPLKDGGQYNRTFDKDRPQVESEADVFAARVLAPACVLWALDLHTAEEISERCDISLAAAAIRAERMQILRKRGMFLTSPLERQVYEQFKQWIEQQK